MDPLIVIIWTCVAVFLATSVIAILSIVNVLKIEPTYQSWLFKCLIAEIIVIGVGGFATYIYKADTNDGYLRLPFAGTPLIENHAPLMIKHKGERIYIKAVSLGVPSHVTVRISGRPDFAGAELVELAASIETDFRHEGTLIKLKFDSMGKLFEANRAPAETEVNLILLDARDASH